MTKIFISTCRWPAIVSLPPMPRDAKRNRAPRFAIFAFAALALAACASNPASHGGQLGDLPREPGRNLALDTGQAPLQCAPYAREHSAVKIYGDAKTWWDKAAEKFQRVSVPASGSVMVLTGYSAEGRAHLAVVRKIISSREIRIDHANWLDDGSIYINDPVVDVSAHNDWSVVTVWNIKSGTWGLKSYPVQGFIAGRQAQR